MSHDHNKLPDFYPEFEIPPDHIINQRREEAERVRAFLTGLSEPKKEIMRNYFLLASLNGRLAIETLLLKWDIKKVGILRGLLAELKDLHAFD